MGKIWGGFLVATGFVACPCHLPLTLPLLLAALGGTGVGAFVAAHTKIVYGIAAAYFAMGIGAGFLPVEPKERRWRSPDLRPAVSRQQGKQNEHPDG